MRSIFEKIKSTIYKNWIWLPIVVYAVSKLIRGLITPFDNDEDPPDQPTWWT